MTFGRESIRRGGVSCQKRGAKITLTPQKLGGENFNHSMKLKRWDLVMYIVLIPFFKYILVLKLTNSWFMITLSRSWNECLESTLVFIWELLSLRVGFIERIFKFYLCQTPLALVITWPLYSRYNGFYQEGCRSKWYFKDLKSISIWCWKYNFSNQERGLTPSEASRPASEPKALPIISNKMKT